MKLNKIMLAAAVAFGVSSTAFAADQGHGKVTFSGAITDAPCSISPGSADQTVELGQVSNSLLKKGGKSVPKAFTIDLEHCELEKDKSKVSVTFNGVESKNGMLAISGTASGASVAITDAGGKILPLGTASTAVDVKEGNTTMRFAAYLQGDTASGAVVPGDFTAIADFTMAYQ
ncbi:TPA: type 1 fimbrial protein [Serratia marcescens]|nr:type 1 fimbrial protein [Serratia marcescens]HAV2137648.1 type 1 fimbrial protein [Serratia marcescens]